MNSILEPEAFANEWIAAWNAQDLDRILSHYGENVIFRSPRIVLITGDETGIVRGMDALRTYWRKALDQNTDLRFELERVYVSKGAITITYRNHRGQSAAETMIFDDRGLVVEGLAAYAS